MSKAFMPCIVSVTKPYLYSVVFYLITGPAPVHQLLPNNNLAENMKNVDLAEQEVDDSQENWR